MSKARTNYNKAYFNWYQKIGLFVGKINNSKFEKFIFPNDKVLDFGCGAGYLLKTLNCKEKHGVEINPTAIKIAKANKIKIFSNSKKLKKNYYDKIISNNTLQHCNNPQKEISLLYNALKKNGLIIIVTGCSSRDLEYTPKDINYQMYSWSPMNLGNFLDNSHFKVLLSKKIMEKWPPYFNFFYNTFGVNIFKLICRIYSLIDSKITPVIAVGKK